MLTITPTKDVGKMMEVLKHPGIWKRIVGPEVTEEQAADVLDETLNNDQNHFFLVMDEGVNLGFTAYVFVTDGVYAIHNCLMTLGSRSEMVIRDSLAQMKEMGAFLIITAYPAANRSARNMASKIGFQPDTTGHVKELLPTPEGEPYLYQYLKLKD